MDLPQYGPWVITHKGDQSCRLLADRHYSRQKKGSPLFTRPGKNLVLRTPEGDATFVVWNGIRDDGLIAWENTLFRNESSFQSSYLLKWGIHAVYTEWGTPPKDGLITYVHPQKVNSIHPGYCYLKSGFKKIGHSKSGLLILQFKYRFINQWSIIELKQIEKYYDLKEKIKKSLDDGKSYEAYRYTVDLLKVERTIKRVQRKLKEHGNQAFSDFATTVSDEQLWLAGITL